MAFKGIMVIFNLQVWIWELSGYGKYLLRAISHKVSCISHVQESNCLTLGFESCAWTLFPFEGYFTHAVWWDIRYMRWHIIGLPILTSGTTIHFQYIIVPLVWGLRMIRLFLGTYLVIVLDSYILVLSGHDFYGYYV